MTRRHLGFTCHDAKLIGTLDINGPEAHQRQGLLMVSGGNEIRSGAHRGMALLAQRIAEAGPAVFRFDRRGIGDSEGANIGFEGSRDDIAAALDAFRSACPGLESVSAFGNCDAATALILHGADLGFDRLILANPWVMAGAAEPDDANDDTHALPPAAAIRRRYIEKLMHPASLWRLLSGRTDLRKLQRGLRGAIAPAAPSSLALRVIDALEHLCLPVTILVAAHDRTAQAFVAAWDGETGAKLRINSDIALISRDSHSHSFADKGDFDWLAGQILAQVAD